MVHSETRALQEHRPQLRQLNILILPIYPSWRDSLVIQITSQIQSIDGYINAGLQWKCHQNPLMICWELARLPIGQAAWWFRSLPKSNHHVTTRDPSIIFHHNPFITFWVVLLTDTQTERQTDKHGSEKRGLCILPNVQKSHAAINILKKYRSCHHFYNIILT